MRKFTQVQITRILKASDKDRIRGAEVKLNLSSCELKGVL